MLLRIAWRNIWRQKRRTLITVVAMGAGVGFSMAMIAFMDGFYVQGFDLMVSQTLGHGQIHNPDYPTQRTVFDTIDDGEALVEQLEQVPEVTAVSGRVFGYALVGTDDRPGRPQKSAGAQLLGVDPTREAPLTGIADKVLAGRYLADEPAQEAVLGAGLAESLNADIGDELVAVTQAADGSMGNEIYTIVGIFQTGSVMQDRSGVFLHVRDLQELLVLEGQLHEVALMAAEMQAIPGMIAATRAAVGRDDLLIRSWEEINPLMVQLLSLQDVANAVLLMMVFSVAALGILNTMLMSVFERTKELGVIRALGLKPTQMVSLVLLETCALVLVSGVLGAALGLGLDAYLCTHGLDFGMFMSADSYSMGGARFPTLLVGHFRWTPVLQTLVGLALISLFAAIWPAIRAARLRPVEAMRQE